MPTFHVEDGSLEGVTWVSTAADRPRPHIGVIAALHGDEICGLSAHEELLARARAGTLPLRRGTLVLIHGNVEATRRGTRYTEEGYDLNRICNLRFRDTLPEASWGYEHHRAIELVPLLCDLDGAIDLHSASAPTVPFAVALPGSLEMAKKLGVQWITHNWEEASDISDGVALARVASRGMPAAAIECGQHDDAEAPHVALDVVHRFLHALGIWGETPPPTDVVPRVLRIVLALPKATEDFRFVTPINGFDQVSEGQLIGRDGTVEMRSPSDAFAVLPNDGVPLRKNVLYLALPDSD